MGLALGNRIYRSKNHGVVCYFGNYWILGMFRTFGLFMSEVTKWGNRGFNAQTAGLHGGDCGLQFVRLLIVSLLAGWGLDLRITDC